MRLLKYLGTTIPKSKRSTEGYYFNSEGNLVAAPAYALRPNYEYQNGVWVRNGWLKEPAATNSYQWADNPALTSDEKFPSIANVTDNLLPTSLSPDVAGHPNATMVFRTYLKATTGSTTSFWWGSHGGRPILSVNYVNGTISGNVTYYNASMTDVGDGWWQFIAHFGSDSVDGYFPPWLPGSGYLMACPQVEAGTTPTSWIPYGQTRATD